ncbi:Os02g0479900 [Oryza sativa Japonica Group]|uniref:Os02g0479900 protein n=1 Tax=Oryza sativa subsp. japonica TaxID=39947 RepID=A0A0P0VJ49_ORYSJ|nr:Os02g0479900 [Oryza sativa Japonica Group]
MGLMGLIDPYDLTVKVQCQNQPTANDLFGCLFRFRRARTSQQPAGDFFDVIGLVVHVVDIEFRSLYLRRTRIIALVNPRLQIIFVRVWDQQLTRNLTRWRSPRTHFDCFVATLTRVDRRADELSTTYESDIIFNPDSASANEFNVLRQALEVSPSNVQEQVEESIARRNLHNYQRQN